MDPIAYLDSSALVKLLVPEAESVALEAYLADKEQLASSRLAATELRRACVASGRRRYLQQADDLLARVWLLDVTGTILESAGRIEPASLRTLDAIHLVTVLSLNEEAVDVITYDDRLAIAARHHGLRVVQPGA